MRRWTLSVIALVACSSGAPEPRGGDPPDAAAPSGDSSVAPGSSESGVSSAEDDGGEPLDAGSADDASSARDAGDGAACEWGGSPGACIDVTACAALGDHSSYAGECPGPASIECCIQTPSTADNPPVPAGYEVMQQSEVTSDMTTWAVAILDDPVTYPMFATTTKTFGTLTVLARVEWHPPDFQNGVVHRGVTLYEPI